MRVQVSVCATRLTPPIVGKILQKGSLLVGPEHKVYALDAAHGLGLQLGVAPHHHDEGPGILTDKAVDGLTALVVGHVGNRARVDDAQVGTLSRPGLCNAHLAQKLGYGGRLGEIQLTAQCIICGLFASKSKFIYHIYNIVVNKTAAKVRIFAETKPPSLPHNASQQTANFLTIRIYLAINALRKSYIFGRKKVRKKRTTYRKNIYLCIVLINK